MMCFTCAITSLHVILMMTPWHRNVFCQWPFVKGIHWSPVDPPHNGPVTQSSMFSLMLPQTNCWTNSQVASDLRCHDTHVTSMWCLMIKHAIMGLNCTKKGEIPLISISFPFNPRFYISKLISVDWFHLHLPFRFFMINIEFFLPLSLPSDWYV